MAIVVKMPASEIPAKVKDIDLEFFKKNVFDIEQDEFKFIGEKPCVVDFYTEWCGPCKSISPVLDELLKDYDGDINIYKIDIEKEQELSVTFGVMSVPTLMFVSKNVKPTQIPGIPDKTQLSDIIDELLKKDRDDNK